MGRRHKNLTPHEKERQGDVEGRDQYVRDNAVAIVNDLKAKVERQAEQLHRLNKSNRSLRSIIADMTEAELQRLARIDASDLSAGLWKHNSETSDMTMTMRDAIEAIEAYYATDPPLTPPTHVHITKEQEAAWLKGGDRPAKMFFFTPVWEAESFRLSSVDSLPLSQTLSDADRPSWVPPDAVPVAHDCYAGPNEWAGRHSFYEVMPHDAKDRPKYAPVVVDPHLLAPPSRPPDKVSGLPHPGACSVAGSKTDATLLNSLRVFIGWDSRFPEPARVLHYSLKKHATIRLDVSYLELSHLENVYGFKRDLDPKQSTEFTYTRFLVPYLCDYQGLALFLDNDMLCLSDIREIAELPMAGLALRVRKHDQQVAEGSLKMYGAVQTAYPRKNWSSAMLMDCEALRLWTRNAVERESGAYLHRFHGIHDSAIGELPDGWNDLTDLREGCKLLHMTEGGPWNKGYENCPGADVWRQYQKEMREQQAKLQPSPRNP